MPAQDSQLLDLLLKQGNLKRQDYERVKAEVLAGEGSVEELLLKHNLVAEKDLAKAKAEV